MWKRNKRPLTRKKPLRCRFGKHEWMWKFIGEDYWWWTDTPYWYDVTQMDRKECKLCHEYVEYTQEQTEKWRRLGL